MSCEAVFIREGKECEVHEMATAGLAQHIVKEGRSRFPKGIDVCKSCLERARDAVKK